MSQKSEAWLCQPSLMYAVLTLSEVTWTLGKHNLIHIILESQDSVFSRYQKGGNSPFFVQTEKKNDHITGFGASFDAFPGHK